MLISGRRLPRRFLWLAGLLLGLLVVGLVVARELRPAGGAGEPPLTTTAAAAEVGDGGPYPYSHLRNLVMVAGHAVYVSRRCGSASSEDSWFLEPYQRLAGQAATFVEHIRTGVEAAAGDNAALLIFSGGQTRSAAGPRSEAQSYWTVADTHDWFGQPEVAARALTEEFARDSLENLLFSVCRFHELTGAYPNNITVVSYDFKRARFAELHREALGFPAARFHFIGTPVTASNRLSAKLGERRTVAAFAHDPFGCSKALHGKRLMRNPFARTLPYPRGCPELGTLFAHCDRSANAARVRTPLPWS
eukprot:SM000159S01759  [mRNA]  locus=s159:59407:61012:- [translate_table: standard]